MQHAQSKLVTLDFVALLGIHAFMGLGRAQNPASARSAQIPMTWDDEAVAALEVPLAKSVYSPVHVASNYCYRMFVRPVYKSYPIYHPGKEPQGYPDWLKQQEPEIVFEASKPLFMEGSQDETAAL